MVEKNLLGGVLAEVAGPLKDFAEKLGGEEGEQWLVAFKRFLRKEEPWPKPLFPIWKTIKLGTSLKTAEDFHYALHDGGFKVSYRVNGIMSRQAFAQSLIGVDPEQEYDLVLLTTAQLIGKKHGGTNTEVFAGAARLGLEKCPAWMGPKLRLQYKDQPNMEWILVGIEPILGSDGDPRVFGVERNDSELWLYAHWGSPDGFWNADYQWVFCRPRK